MHCKIALISVITISLTISSTSGNRVVIIGGKLFGERNASTQTAWEGTKAPKNAAIEHLLQPVDHQNPTKFPLWSQRYFTNFTKYSESGPILIFIGGEAEADPRFLAYGEMAENAVALKAAATFTLEHRFYGQSWPLNDSTVTSLQYLTMPQALDDLANFVTHIKTKYDLEESKVVVYGGSYAGSLAAYFLQFYPQLASAGVASSAPIWFHFDFKEYLELAAASIKVTNPKCLDILGSGVRALNRIIQQSSYQCGFVPLSGGGNPANPCNVELGTFPLCSPLDAHKTGDIYQLNSYITQFFIYIAQYNSTLPETFNLDALCNATLSYKEIEGLSDFEVLAKIMTSATHGLYNSPCVDQQVENFCAFMSQTGAEDEASKQVCSDFATFASSSGLRHPFGQYVPASHYVAQCECVFGSLFTEAFIRLRVDQHTAKFGSYSTLRRHVVYLNGNTDPVAGLGYSKRAQFQASWPNDNNDLFIVERGSHCDDLYAYDSTQDSASLQQARNGTLQILKRWLNMAKLKLLLYY
ncbi:Thymus-specific serine protease [Folsomia candida]|uniref:Thymus-specific serine protease n=1 Tax=Folsomia candida TaxID=158441 RepID=A0A226CZ36_FOLCA|nr:Thymus-specific serine protease [Folsomia candida]